MVNLQLLAFLPDRDGLIIGHLHHDAADFRAKMCCQLLFCCFRILNGIVQQGAADYIDIGYMNFVAENINEGNGVVDIGERIDILATLVAVLVRCEGQRFDE